MKKKVISIAISVSIALIATTGNVYAKTPINPTDNVYKEGIHKINKNDVGKYQLQFKFLNEDIDLAIIVLGRNADILYKNINCNRRCNVGTITSRDTIVIIIDGEVELSFTKIN